MMKSRACLQNWEVWQGQAQTTPAWKFMHKCSLFPVLGSWLVNNLLWSLMFGQRDEARPCDYGDQSQLGKCTAWWRLMLKLCCVVEFLQNRDMVAAPLLQSCRACKSSPAGLVTAAAVLVMEQRRETFRLLSPLEQCLSPCCSSYSHCGIPSASIKSSSENHGLKISHWIWHFFFSDWKMLVLLIFSPSTLLWHLQLKKNVFSACFEVTSYLQNNDNEYLKYK